MKQIEMFRGHDARTVVNEANAWIAEQHKAVEAAAKKKNTDAKKAEALLETEAPKFEHSDPVISVVGNQMIITIVYTAA